MYTLDSEMVVNDEVMAVDSKFKGKRPVDPNVTCMGYSCQGMMLEFYYV